LHIRIRNWPIMLTAQPFIYKGLGDVPETDFGDNRILFHIGIQDKPFCIKILMP